MLLGWSEHEKRRQIHLCQTIRRSEMRCVQAKMEERDLA